LALHGGPTSDLFAGTFEYFEEIPTFSIVEVKKHEMLTTVLENDDLTLEQGHAVNDTTAALIEKAVQYFKNQDKTVVILGHSWGAIIMGEYLDDYGVESVHRIIPMEGRLNMQVEFIDYLLDGYLPTFDSDGFSLVLSTPQYNYEKGLMMLAAAAFSNRWVDSLAHLDLSKMMYTYAENDMNTGALLPEETALLDNTGAQTLFIPSGIHGDSYLDVHQATIVEFIRTDLLTATQEPAFVNEPLNLFPTLTNNIVQIESEQTGTLRIFDMSGRKIHQAQVMGSPMQINVSNFGNGQYFAVLQSGTQKLSTAKFQVTN